MSIKPRIGPGDIIRSAGFGCIPDGESRTVESDFRGALFIRCACGRHYLDPELRGLRIELHDEPWQPSPIGAVIARLFGWPVSTTSRRFP